MYLLASDEVTHKKTQALSLQYSKKDLNTVNDDDDMLVTKEVFDFVRKSHRAFLRCRRQEGNSVHVFRDGTSTHLFFIPR